MENNIDETIKEVESKLPEFHKEIKMCLSGKADGIALTIHAFENDPELFYKAMLYAHIKGVSVMLVPSGSTVHNVEIESGELNEGLSN